MKKQGERQAPFQSFKIVKVEARKALTTEGHRWLHGLMHCVVRFLPAKSLP
jgi:hypothetical protein